MASLEEQIGGNVRALRGANTGEALGEVLERLLGRAWSRQAVSDAERGKRSFTAAELLALADALGVTVPQLFETAEPVTMPSGHELAPVVVDALTAPLASERDRTARLLAELAALRRVRENLRQANRLLERSMIRVELAAKGLPIKPVHSPIEGAFGDAFEHVFSRVDALLDEWAGLTEEAEQ